MYDIGVTTYALCLLFVIMYKPGKYMSLPPWPLFLIAFAVNIACFSRTIWFAFGAAALAIAIMLNHIRCLTSQADDECASFKWSHVTNHSTCFMCALTAAYVSIFAL